MASTTETYRESFSAPEKIENPYKGKVKVFGNGKGEGFVSFSDNIVFKTYKEFKKDKNYGRWKRFIESKRKTVRKIKKVFEKEERKEDFYLKLRKPAYNSPELSEYMRGELDKRLSISKKLGKDKVLLKIELPEKREEKFREKLRNDTQDYLEKKRKRAESKRKAVEHMIGALGMTPERMKSLIDSGFHTYSGKEFEEELRKLPKFEVKVV